MIVPFHDLIAPVTHAHWMPFMTYWTASAVVIYAVLLVGSWVSKTPERAWWFAMPAPVVCLVGASPALAYLTAKQNQVSADYGHIFLTVVLPLSTMVAVLAGLPMVFRNRIINRVNRARKLREMEADALR